MAINIIHELRGYWDKWRFDKRVIRALKTVRSRQSRVSAWSALIFVGLCLIFAGIATLIPQSWWTHLEAAVRNGGRQLTLLIAGLLAVLAGMQMQLRATRREPLSAAPLPPARQLKPIPTWVIPAGGLAVIAVTAISVWLLENRVPQVGSDLQEAQLSVTAIRTGLSVGAGTAGALALLLALRRQQLAERTQQANEYDAGEKRVTELYVKAAEQLGSDKAPVRLAGLYALERLAQDNPVHRASITEVVCAYLRMPYESSPTDSGNSTETDQSRLNEPSTPHAQSLKLAQEERQVRLAAQRILARHFKVAKREEKSPNYWGPLPLDLTEATLLNASFSRCLLHNANFQRAKFIGTAFFGEAEFEGVTQMDGAVFEGGAWFVGAKFSTAWFDEAKFLGSARFERCTFDSTREVAWCFKCSYPGKRRAWRAETISRPMRAIRVRRESVIQLSKRLAS